MKPFGSEADATQGVRKLLDIGMATVRNPKLIMLDEPTSGISVEEKFGLMDIIIVPTRPSLAALRLLPSVYSGTYLKDPDLIHLRGRQIHAQCLSGPTPDVDVDGEAPGTLEAEFDTVVGAIRMLDVAAELLQHAP